MKGRHAISLGSTKFLLLVTSILSSGEAWAEDGEGQGAPPYPASEARAHSPVAINAWAGLSLVYLHSSDSYGFAPNYGYALAGKLGGDLGFRFSRPLSVVALLDYHVFPSEEGSSGFLLLAPGLRWQRDLSFQLAFAAGLLVPSGGAVNGIGLRAMAFWPMLGGFGPCLQAGFNAIGNVQLVDLALGISLSY